ncbi:MAG: UMP kinase [Candidatus Micrarchaeia archaeon]
MQTVCISLGGSVIAKEEGLNYKYIMELRRVIERHKQIRFVIVVGGGYTNRQYIKTLRSLGVSEYELDELGIAFTRVNATAVKSIFSGDDIYTGIASSVDEVKNANSKYRIVFACGFMPGMTTDAVSAISCEAVKGSMLINVSRDAYVYDRDPNGKGSKRLLRISHERMCELASKYDTREAKAPFVFDIVASKIATRSNIRVEFVDDNILDLGRAIDLKRHKGSSVID